MEINLNIDGTTSYEIFNISLDRANVILEHLIFICETAARNYESDYRVFGVVAQENGSGELMERINTGKLLRQMLDFATTEDEKNFILYCAHTGIEVVRKNVFS